MENIPFVLQYPWATLQQKGFPHKGKWNSFFGNDNPITLELGCGKGEYTTGLATRYPNRNMVGIDVKGARMWTGARLALEQGLDNVAFLRTDIDLLPHFFAPGEVEEIWITFPDPQMQKERKRLTGSKMLEMYRKVLKPSGTINLKTDSPFLYTYTRMLCQSNNLPVHIDTDNLYSLPLATEHNDIEEALKGIRTYYEQQWINRGLNIKFLRFELPEDNAPIKEPEGRDNIPRDTYRSDPHGGNIISAI